MSALKKSDNAEHHLEKERLYPIEVPTSLMADNVQSEREDGDEAQGTDSEDDDEDSEESEGEDSRPASFEHAKAENGDDDDDEEKDSEGGEDEQ